MGPDCGTAYLNGMGVGFTNVVPRGRIGCVAAAGTGLQAVVSRVAALGEGVSHGIGVGGRDLSSEVGGMMTLFALEALADDPSTEAIVIISKPPHPTILPRWRRPLRRSEAGGGVRAGRSARRRARRWVDTLDAAADAVVALITKRTPRPFAIWRPDRDWPRLQRRRADRPEVLGLYTGGTLAHEAHLLLDSLLGHDAAASDPRSRRRSIHRGPAPPHDRSADPDGHDPKAGQEKAGYSWWTWCWAEDRIPIRRRLSPAAIRQASAMAAAAGRRLIAVGSVVGTVGDPQDLAGQVAQLEEAGVELLPSNAEAARFAALLVKPELAETLLEVSR